MNILERHSGPGKTTHSRAAPQFLFSFIFFHFSFIFFHFLSCSCIFFHFLFIFFSFSYVHFLFIFFHFLSCSFMFVPVLSCSVIFCHFPFHCSFHFVFKCFQNPFFAFRLPLRSSFYWVLIMFLPRLPHDFLLKLLCKKSIFWAVSEGTPLGPLFFLLSISSFFFHFRFLFQFLSMLFLFFLCFSFFHSLFLYFPVVFLFQKKSLFFLFHFCFSFFSSRVLKIFGGTPGFLGEKCTF